MVFLATWIRSDKNSIWKNHHSCCVVGMCRRECLEKAPTCQRIWRCAWTSVLRAKHGKGATCPRFVAWWPCVRSSAILRSSKLRVLCHVCKGGISGEERGRTGTPILSWIADPQGEVWKNIACIFFSRKWWPTAMCVIYAHHSDCRGGCSMQVPDLSSCSSAYSVIMVSTSVKLTLAGARHVYHKNSGHGPIIVM